MKFALALAVLPLVAFPAAQSYLKPMRSGLTIEQQEILSHMSIVYLDDGVGGQTKTIRFTGVNVQIVNGLDFTETQNSVGNLIVGYNEMGNPFGDNRTGSHNVVLGLSNNYASFGGHVAGWMNSILGEHGSVLGGRQNIVGPASTVGNVIVSGMENTISNSWGSAIISGRKNTVEDSAYSAIVAGSLGVARGGLSAILGGNQNETTGGNSVVGGGFGNSTQATNSFIAGGVNNTVELTSAAGSVFGGEGNFLGNSYAGVILGGLDNFTSQGGGSNSNHATVTGGQGNFIDGAPYGAISGGLNRSVTGPHDWAAGSLTEDQ